MGPDELNNNSTEPTAPLPLPLPLGAPSPEQLAQQRAAMASHLQEASSLERALHPEEDEEGTARRLFRENLIGAVSSICQIATSSSNERLRVDAAKYIVERNLGKINDLGDFAKGKNPFEDFLASIVSQEHIQSSAPIEPSAEDRLAQFQATVEADINDRPVEEM